MVSSDPLLPWGCHTGRGLQEGRRSEYGNGAPLPHSLLRPSCSHPPAWRTQALALQLLLSAAPIPLLQHSWCETHALKLLLLLVHSLSSLSGQGRAATFAPTTTCGLPSPRVIPLKHHLLSFFLTKLQQILLATRLMSGGCLEPWHCCLCHPQLCNFHQVP